MYVVTMSGAVSSRTRAGSADCLTFAWCVQDIDRDVFAFSKQAIVVGDETRIASSGIVEKRIVMEERHW